jgi:hypothetical protein
LFKLEYHLSAVGEHPGAVDNLISRDAYGGAVSCGTNSSLDTFRRDTTLHRRTKSRSCVSIREMVSVS